MGNYAGGTLLISRSVNNHTYFKTQLEKRGFPKVIVTSADKDGLNFVINDVKPKLVIIGAGFYYCSTAYMMCLLLKKFPELNIAAVSISPYPANLAKWFIHNGVNSYINFDDGADDFFIGLACIKEGKKYISQLVKERFETMEEPAKTDYASMRELEVIKLTCNGFTEPEIGDTLHISKRTITHHKENIYEKFNVRNEKELIGVAITSGTVNPDELIFYHKDHGKSENKKLPQQNQTIRRVK